MSRPFPDNVAARMNALVNKNKRENLTPAEIAEYRGYETKYGYGKGSLNTEKRPIIADMTARLQALLAIVRNRGINFSERIVAMVKAEDLFFERQRVLRQPAPLAEIQPPAELMEWVDTHSEAIRRKIEERGATTIEALAPIINEIIADEHAEFYAGQAANLPANRGSPSLAPSASAAAAEEGVATALQNFNSRLRAAGVQVTVDPGNAGGAAGARPARGSRGGLFKSLFGLKGGRRLLKRNRRTQKGRSRKARKQTRKVKQKKSKPE